MRHLICVIFYSNIFYGICAVALCIETNLIHKLPLNIFPFYLLIFSCTWLYYTMIYVRSVGAKNYDERTLWYRRHLRLIKLLLKLTLALVATFILYLLIKNLNSFYGFKVFQWLMILVFPLVAALYTFKFPLFYYRKIRQIGWLKPFVVGFTWSGWVTVYPLLVWQVLAFLNVIWGFVLYLSFLQALEKITTNSATNIFVFICLFYFPNLIKTTNK